MPAKVLRSEATTILFRHRDLKGLNLFRTRQMPSPPILCNGGVEAGIIQKVVSMQVVGVIPARWGSTRFPGKSLTPLGGKPLIQWVFDRCRQARRLNRLLVATDDDRIRRVVEAFGGDVVMTRSDHPSGTDRVAEAIRQLPADVIVNVQGDEPMIDPVLVDRLVESMVSELGWDMATAAAPLTSADEAQRASVCKVVFNGMGQALYFSRWPIPFVRDPSFRPKGVLYWRHVGIYLYRRQFLERLVKEPPSMLEQAECLEQLRALHLGGRIKVLPVETAGMGVDVPEDVAVVEAALRRTMLK